MRKNDFIRDSIIKGFYKINIIASYNIGNINIGLPILKNYYVILIIQIIQLDFVN